MKLFNYRHLPLTAYLAYSAFVLATLLGPVKFANLEQWVLFSFLAPYFVLFLLGYLWGVKGSFHVDRELRTASGRAGYKRIRKWFKYLLLTAACYCAFEWGALVLSGGGISFDLGERYNEYYSGYERGQANIDIGYILTILIQAIVVLTVLFGLTYFEHLEPRRKILVVFVVFSYVIVNMLTAGKQKYFGDAAIYLLAAGAISMASRNVRISPRLAAKAGIAALITLLVFVEVLHQRYSFQGIDVTNIAYKSHPLIDWDVDSFIVQVLGPGYGFAVGSVLFYFSNGLYGLYLSLTLPFEWSYLVGNSYSLGRIVEIAVGDPGLVLEETYPYRVGVTYGWGLDKWHSAFAWLASDIGFGGILLITPLFARFYARIWKEAVAATNIASGPLFLYLTLGLAFSYSNNQLVHAMSGVLVLIFLLLLRRRDRVRKSRFDSHFDVHGISR